MYIFTATHGRCGTQTLCRLLNQSPDIVAYHEPSPRFEGDVMFKHNTNPSDKHVFRLWTEKKVDAIAKDKGDTPHYAEVTHMFLKTFGYLATEEYEDVKVIHLWRNRFETAASWLKIRLWQRFWVRGMESLTLTPNLKLNLIPPLDGMEKHEFYWFLWHWYEMEARMKQYRRIFVNVPVFDIEMPELNDQNKINELFTWIYDGLETTCFKPVGLHDVNKAKIRQYTWGPIVRKSLDEVRAMKELTHKLDTQWQELLEAV